MINPYDERVWASVQVTRLEELLRSAEDRAGAHLRALTCAHKTIKMLMESEAYLKEQLRGKT
jgi:hypothetical protein